MLCAILGPAGVLACGLVDDDRRVEAGVEVSGTSCTWDSGVDVVNRAGRHAFPHILLLSR